MMTARFFSGASLFAFLVVDICCFPTEKGTNPGPSYGDTNAAPNFGSKQGAPVGHFSQGAAVPNHAPKVASAPSYQPAPQPSFSQPAVQSSAQPQLVIQSGPREFDWAVAPLTPGERRASGTSAVGFSGPENVSPPYQPPEPVYHAGELSQYESTFEHGDYQTETEEQGYLPPPPFPPMQAAPVAEQSYTSPPEPQVQYWGPYPPYYDYMFLRGLYPPGTVTHASSSYEQGHDDWQDAHYERYYPSNAQQMDTFTNFQVPQTFDVPSQPVKQPSANYMQPTYQAGGQVPRY